MTAQGSAPAAEDDDLYAGLESEGLDPGEIEESTGHAPSIADDLMLRSNTMIPAQGIFRFRCQSRTQTVVLIGEHKSGKTTLLATIYGLFCRGPVGSVEFIRSETLYSFAERSYLAMMAPDRTAPTTPRTSIAESVGYFHLKVRNGECVSDVVISDRSGETFEAARVDTSLVDRLTEMALADRICFLLDAARLTNTETRHNYRRTFKQTIRALRDNNVIRKTAVVEVLVTKTDRISGKKSRIDLEDEVAKYEDELKIEFVGAFGDFAIHRICALPRANVKIGFFGMAELIARWASPPADANIVPQPIEDALRYIDRSPYIWR